MLPWPQLDVQLNSIGRVRCEPGWQLAPGWSDRLQDFDLWFVWAGRGMMQLTDRQVALRPGVCFWMRPGGVYQATQDSADRLGVTYLHFDLLDHSGQPLGAIPGHGALPAEVVQFEDVQYIDVLLRRLTELAGIRPQARPVNPVSAQALQRQLLRTVLQEYDALAGQPASLVPGGTQRHHRQLVLRLAAQISESPHDTPPVSELARQAGYSPDHFARVFRAVVGQNPQAYIVQARIDRARQLLAESSLSISQIAEVLRYDDVFFFSRQFKQKTGLTPTQYRSGDRSGAVAARDSG